MRPWVALALSPVPIYCYIFSQKNRGNSRTKLWLWFMTNTELNMNNRYKERRLIDIKYVNKWIHNLSDFFWWSYFTKACILFGIAYFCLIIIIYIGSQTEVISNTRCCLKVSFELKIFYKSLMFMLAGNYLKWSTTLTLSRHGDIRQWKRLLSVMSRLFTSYRKTLPLLTQGLMGRRKLVETAKRASVWTIWCILHTKQHFHNLLHSSPCWLAVTLRVRMHRCFNRSI